MNTTTIAAIEMSQLETVVGGTYKQGVAQRAAGQAEVDRSLVAAGQAASAARSAQFHQTLGQDMGVGQNWGAKIGGAIGRGVAAIPGFFHGVWTGQSAASSTFDAELNK